MEINEFLEPQENDVEPEELDVQKAVVESLATEKAECDERIASLLKENYKLNTEISRLKSKLDEMEAEFSKIGDILSANSDGVESSKIALLDRNPDLGDRFEGETRDHVLEVIEEARNRDEKEGRIRRAQVLEAILLVNEKNGKLVEKRERLSKLFADNGNIISGKVIEELKKVGISYKNGESYLLPAEIIKREY